MDSNKKMAALLFFLLPADVRKSIRNFLSSQELESLKHFYRQLPSLSPEEKIRLEKKLLFIFCYDYKRIFQLFFLFLFVFFATGLVYHTLTFPRASPLYVLSLFFPLGWGMFSFLLLSTFSPFTIYVYFRLPKEKYFYLFSLMTVYVQLFILYAINEMEKVTVSQLTLVEKFILLAGITTAPVGEEIIFRHRIPEVFGNTFFRNITGHVVSNALFSMMHLPNSWEQGILYFFSGMFFSILKITTQSLILPVLSHSLANGIFFLLF